MKLKWIIGIHTTRKDIPRQENLRFHNPCEMGWWAWLFLLYTLSCILHPSLMKKITHDGEKNKVKGKSQGTHGSHCYYSQTRCSFPRNFANSRRNVGILIHSLLWAICNRLVHLGLWRLQIFLHRFLCQFLFKLKISLGTLLSWFLVHADDNWGRSDHRNCLNNVFIVTLQSWRKNNATIKFLFILIWQHITLTIFLSDLYYLYCMWRYNALLMTEASDSQCCDRWKWNKILLGNFKYQNNQNTPHCSEIWPLPFLCTLSFQSIFFCSMLCNVGKKFPLSLSSPHLRNHTWESC